MQTENLATTRRLLAAVRCQQTTVAAIAQRAEVADIAAVTDTS
ncbi:hypothetical protein [Tomitella biformata]|nr:hypothetical protein [Tomitella biformata]